MWEDTVLTDDEIIKTVSRISKEKGAPLSDIYIYGRISTPVKQSIKEAE